MMPLDSFASRVSDEELTALRPLQRQFPNLDSALAELARLSAKLTLPRDTIHVISDIHGSDVKLRHVINNASGMLRPMVERLFADRLQPGELKELLTLIFYPRETLERLEPCLTEPGQRRTYCQRMLRALFELMRCLARRNTLVRASRRFPPEYRELFIELLLEPLAAHRAEYYEALISTLIAHDRAFPVIRQAVRVARNLAIDELIIGGDCWDRGDRGDRVVDSLMRQPNVSFTWGNHDAAWLGACLGNEALIAHVLRISLRYRTLRQLEEGYGIALQPLEAMVRQLYSDDPATCYTPRGTGLRDPILVARMQKAAAMMQFKLEGQLIARNPEWGLDNRRLLHQMDLRAGTITVEGKTYPLRDTRWPTLDPKDPYQLSAEEKATLDRFRQAFLSSRKLWDHMHFLAEHGSMYLIRDNNLIFHGCIPVDQHGNFQTLSIDGKNYAGRALFDVLDLVIARAMQRRMTRDLDLLWYLWCGPRSPLFGKDKIATLEIDLIAEKQTHVETKNPYFSLIHEVPFCDRVLQEFGCDPARGLIVNGHVPVKIEKGESPIKRSGKAITIDGAFSEAYGDHGYTLVLEPERTLLAKHHHFASVEAAVRDGVDIIPTISVVREWSGTRRVGDTDQGAEIHRAMAWLEKLIRAYRGNQLREE
jgi:fructose-1,6-bisphosphatase-3